ncbi:PEP-CTERM sorting domain-containing protein [Paludisphaera mucosa]|uniref:PEP-CTERM sorting domain-containing protein n=1 Tax=Paludisphaera mucosa TaxID=3030827 RepID=A0ABT6FLG5_9BACT|nr:PEP-CTERM sorting domain-containing protein [Paludisphaera mucosa]MDG3008415.1 PEP-CTERM sorting domain-containing protein [Paludisphaera mucosa]
MFHLLRRRHHAAIARLALLASSCLAVATSADADVLYETGFEAPTFTAGAPIDGQGGFHTDFFPNASTVSTAFPAGGSQALRIDAASLLEIDPSIPISQNYNWVDLGDPVAGGARVLRVEADVAVFASGPGEVQVGLQAYDRDFNGIAGITITTDDEGTGPKLAYYTDPANPELIAFTSFGEYVHLGMTLDYTLRTASFDLNGVTLGTAAFAPGVGNVSDFDIYMQRIDWSTPTGTVAYFDNYAVTAVPEPASLGLLAGGLGVLAVRARRRNAR